MKTNIDRKEFLALCQPDAETITRHGETYLKKGLARFHQTFQVCSELITQGAKVLSVGAGGAYVEKQLSKLYHADVTVIDFPEAVESHREDYSRHGFHAIGLDVATDWRLKESRQFDMACSFQVLEHLPMSPDQHIRPLVESLKPGGHLLLSTPNLARLLNIARLILGRPILADPQLVFLPTSYDREFVHRREYVASEIIEAMTRAGLKHLKTHYILSAGGKPPDLAKRVGCLVSGLVPRLKNCMLLVARKQPSTPDA